MDQCVSSESAILSQATAKKKRNEKIWNKTNDMCELFETEYNEAENAR